jgi:hypothetical protein
LSRNHYVHDIASDWRYGASLDFYQKRYGAPFQVIWPSDVHPPGKQAYVLFPRDESYAIANHLKIAYRSPEGGIVIAVDPLVDSDFFGSVPYDDTDSQLEFSGHWTRDTQFHSASGGTLTYSNTPGDKFRFSFQGSRATLIYTKAFNRGIANVLMDGKPAAPLDMYAPDIEYQTRSVFEGLRPGRHVIEVLVTGAKNQRATDHAVDVDAIEVQ